MKDLRKKEQGMNDMDLSARIELLGERVKILEKAIETVMKLDDRKIPNVVYSFDSAVIFDKLKIALAQEKEIAI